MAALIYVPGATDLAGNIQEYFSPGAAFISGGNQYPGYQYLSADQIATAKAVEVVAVESAVPEDQRYHTITQSFNGATSTLSAALRSLPEVLNTKLNDLAAHRWNVQSKAVSVNGASVATDAEVVSLLTLAKTCGTSIQFKTNRGFEEWTVDQMGMALAAINAHVQECFTTEALHTAAIKALSDAAAVIAYDFTTGWPV